MQYSDFIFRYGKREVQMVGEETLKFRKEQQEKNEKIKALVKSEVSEKYSCEPMVQISTSMNNAKFRKVSANSEQDFEQNLYLLTLVSIVIMICLKEENQVFQKQEHVDNSFYEAMAQDSIFLSNLDQSHYI